MLTELKADRESWEELVKRGREIIREWYPGWNDDNASDPGITILELFAFLKEVQNFHMEQTGPAHLRKYLKLLGERTLTRQPAKAYVTVDVNKQTRFAEKTRMYAGTISFETVREQTVAGRLFTGFDAETADGGSLLSLRGDWLGKGTDLSLYPFGDAPVKGNRFCMLLSEPLHPGEPYGLYLGYDEQAARRQNPVDMAGYDGYEFLPPAVLSLQIKTKKGWEKARLEDETLGLCRSGMLWFRFNKEMDCEAPAFCLVLETCDYLNAPQLSRISLSMVFVQQQETRRSLPEFPATGFPNQRISLEEEGLCRERFSILVEEAEREGEFREWSFREDLDGSKPEDRHYMLDGSFLVFGNGFHGMIPEGRIRVGRWVRTLGKGGNIKSGTITSLEKPLQSVISLTNECDAVGGRDEETLEEAFERYRNGSFRGVRAVTPEDYEYLVKTAPGLEIEDCHAWLSDRSFNRISIAVRPYKADGMGKLTKTMEQNLYRYLEEKRLVGTRILLVSPEYIFLSVVCEAVGKISYRNSKEIVEEEIRRFTAGKSFGQTLCYGRLFGFLDTLACISEVKALRIETYGRAVRNGAGDVTLPPNGLFILREAKCILYTNS